MTYATETLSHARIVGTRPRAGGAGTPKRRRGARPVGPQRLRTPGDDMADWVQQGACRTSEPELFFPITPPGYTRPKQQLTEAKAVCHRCPVIESCRKWALAHPRMAQYGVWGAMSEEERRTVRRHGDRSGPRS
ncbi:WhiB family transcriptional regulator [Catenulispora pinisilvae]|uniref:WhiB family transcriptional regulator n=1 Tax=Catenulispora pinisilvae TaxID=2705253 RepID=UPI003F6983E6